jgi:hypothetical protein
MSHEKVVCLPFSTCPSDILSGVSMYIAYSVWTVSQQSWTVNQQSDHGWKHIHLGIYTGTGGCDCSLKELLMMAIIMPETCWAASVRLSSKFYDWLLHLVGCFIWKLVNSRAVTTSPSLFPLQRWSSSIATVLISVFTLCYRPGLLFRGPLCIILWYPRHICDPSTETSLCGAWLYRNATVTRQGSSYVPVATFLSVSLLSCSY